MIDNGSGLSFGEAYLEWRAGGQAGGVPDYPAIVANGKGITTRQDCFGIQLAQTSCQGVKFHIL